MSSFLALLWVNSVLSAMLNHSYKHITLQYLINSSLFKCLLSGSYVFEKATLLFSKENSLLILKESNKRV